MKQHKFLEWIIGGTVLLLAACQAAPKATQAPAPIENPTAAAPLANRRRKHAGRCFWLVE